jgi:hypothetical protein
MYSCQSCLLVVSLFRSFPLLHGTFRSGRVSSLAGSILSAEMGLAHRSVQ